MLRKRTLFLMGVCFLARISAAAEPTARPVAPAKLPPPDIRFLEYLGTVEDDEDNWMDVELSASESKSLAAETANKVGKEAPRAVEKK
jgi:hypothetical protein